MNRRELLLGTIAIAVAPALPAAADTLELFTVTYRYAGEWSNKYVIAQSPDTKYLAANDDFAMAA